MMSFANSAIAGIAYCQYIKFQLIISRLWHLSSKDH